MVFLFPGGAGLGFAQVMHVKCTPFAKASPDTTWKQKSSFRKYHIFGFEFLLNGLRSASPSEGIRGSDTASRREEPVAAFGRWRRVKGSTLPGGAGLGFARRQLHGNPLLSYGNP
jgi:hypothetical protein